MDNAKAILEGLLFLSGEEGLTMDQMMHGLQNLEMDDIRVLLDALKKEYSSSSKGIELVEYANRFKFVTKEFVYPYGKQLFEEYKQPTLSQAAMESIIAAAISIAKIFFFIPNLRFLFVRSATCQGAIISMPTILL